MAEHLWTAFNEPRNIERPTDPVHQKIAYGKTSIQKEMFRKNMFCGKCFCRTIRAKDGSSEKASWFLQSHILGPI